MKFTILCLLAVAFAVYYVHEADAFRRRFRFRVRIRIPRIRLPPVRLPRIRLRIRFNRIKHALKRLTMRKPPSQWEMLANRGVFVPECTKAVREQEPDVHASDVANLCNKAFDFYVAHGPRNEQGFTNAIVRAAEVLFSRDQPDTLSDEEIAEMEREIASDSNEFEDTVDFPDPDDTEKVV
ncbi:uncharacterized protein LOC106164468 [Lingula anatina]|uniref:Uncharacterized protein LOC106164468 n=1 Tax=Lingula anatina TaxID=7574 RepID=A0A1S3IK07_LINAN|nr:uncharacterized protein LOC106164468 [Lingula anatina]XP_013397852.1 uncharacterized protein LOC106164468 [Lingula anatina]XP_013397853.1 uncharacterized protein LOC106164468 [Lingula anatina]XP_013397854.1 uncharacterized protein LOC106164468 [Lingula anatina]|eukprot:XP_013397851.1 uncharacterized protein LOC106164468 [Lingula anatina]